MMKSFFIDRFAGRSLSLVDRFAGRSASPGRLTLATYVIGGFY